MNEFFMAFLILCLYLCLAYLMYSRLMEYEAMYSEETNWFGTVGCIVGGLAWPFTGLLMFAVFLFTSPHSDDQANS